MIGRRRASIINGFATAVTALKTFYEDRHLRSARRIYNRGMRKLSK